MPTIKTGSLLSRFHYLIILGFCLLGNSVAMAHEFWIEPVAGIGEHNQPIITELRNGESFDGVAYPYNQDVFVRFELLGTSESVEVSNSRNALPAINVTALDNGPHTLLYVSNRKYLEYETFSDVQHFAAEDGVTDTLNQLVAEGASTDSWTETYTRYTKSLLNVGGTLLKDKPLGLDLEIVLLEPLPIPEQFDQADQVNSANPISEKTVRFRVDYLGEPLPGGMIGIFRRSQSLSLGTLNVQDPDASLHSNKESLTTLTKVHTDENGIFTVNLLPGHDYLLNSVYAKPTGDKLFVIPGLPEKRKASWETLWSSLTFSH